MDEVLTIPHIEDKPSADHCTPLLFYKNVCANYFRKNNPLLGHLLEFLIVLYAFAGLALSADHMCNSMETLCDHWKIPEDVGGASFMAFGNSVPEITVNAIATA